MPKYARFAQVYDAIYGFKNYEAEAARVSELITVHKRSPGNALLDVACGTGNHIAFLRRDYAVEGLDMSPHMLEVARQKFPEIAFHQGDMTTFTLDRRFDAVTCLFSAIGYVKSLRALRKAVANMASHLLPGGVLIIEPWITKAAWKTGTFHALFVDRPDLKIARMDIPAVRDGISVINFHCLVGTPNGIEYFTEKHEAGLFTHQEYLDAFISAGLEASFDEYGLMGRGLYIGSPEQE